jgi:hypothetical protein
MGAALLFMLHASHLAVRDHFTVPNLDDWRILDGYLSQPLLAWLVEGQTGHRMPGTQLLLALDYRLLGGHMHLLAIASVACAWLAFVAAWLTLRSAPVRARVPLLAFTGFALFWAGASYDFLWGTNQGSQQAAMLIWGALAAMAAVQAPPNTRTPPVRVLVAGAALGAVGATFSQGTGVALWAALVVVALVTRLRWWITAALFAAAGGTAALYSHGLDAGSAHPHIYLAILTRQPLEVLWFVASFVGITPTLVVAPMLRGSPAVTSGVGAVCGGVGLVGLAAYAVWLVVRRAAPSRVDVVALGLMTFGAVAGLLVALNRLGWGMMGQERFATWSTLFWIGAVWAIATVVPSRPAHRLVFAGALALVALAATPSLDRARFQHRVRAQRLALEADMLVLDIRRDGEVRYAALDARPDLIYRVTDRLRRDRRSIFATPAAALAGTRLDDHVVGAPAERCRGTIATLALLATRGMPAAKLSGYAWDDAGHAPPSFIVVTDRGGHVRGLGSMQLSLGASGSEGWEGGAAWTAYVPEPRPDDVYVVHGVLEGARAACRVGVTPGAALLAAPLVPALRTHARPARIP